MGALTFSLAGTTIFGKRTVNFGETQISGTSPYWASPKYECTKAHETSSDTQYPLAFPFRGLRRPSARRVAASRGASAGLLAGRLGASPHNPEHRFRNSVHSGGGGEGPGVQVFLPIIHTGKRAPDTEHNNTTTQKQHEGKQDKRTKSRKNGATPSGQQANEKHEAANARAGESGGGGLKTFQSACAIFFRAVAAVPAAEC
jgi:hypothetical protein